MRSNILLRLVYYKFHQYLTQYIFLPQVKNVLPYISNDANMVMTLVSIYETGKYVDENMKNAKKFDNRFALLEYALSEVEFDGMIMEFGVYKGDSINHIAKRMDRYPIYGFDSFEGLPEDWRPGFKKGTFKLEHLPKVKGNVKLIKGYFDQSLPKLLREKNDEYCTFIHIDCDLYSSTKTVFSHIFPYVKKGTVIVFDEYFGYLDWKLGEFKAFQEFVEENKLSYIYLGYVLNNQQVAIKII